MSPVKEIPDDFDETGTFDKSTSTSTVASASIPFPIKSTSTVQDGSTPPLPPQMQSVRSHTADEIVQMMNKTPLFMTSLEGVDDGTFRSANLVLEDSYLKQQARRKCRARSNARSTI